MLYSDHKPMAPFFTTGMSCPILDRWALELQQLNAKFQHIQGKRNMVADAINTKFQHIQGKKEHGS